MSQSRPRWGSALPSLLLAGGLLAGCASSGDARDDQIKELQDRVLELQRKTAVADVELARLRQQVADLMAKQGMGGPANFTSGGAGVSSPRVTGAPAPPDAGGSSWRRPSSIGGAGGGGRPPARIAGGTATPARPTGVVPGQVIDETDIEVPPVRSSPPAPPVQQRLPPPAVTPPPAAPPAAAPPAAAPVIEGKHEPVTPAVQVLYDRGYTLYHQKHYVDAEASFQRFLQAEPNSELADNAQYWIGECRYSRGDMRGALAAFRETVARYPAGNKTADALLKAGMSLENLGDKEAARNTYQEVLRRFPGTAVAAVAEERRAKLP